MRIRTVMTALAFLALAFAILPPVKARADETVEDTVKSVITGQITAFIAGDFDSAYGYAAPGIRDRFSDSESFVAMVKAQYAPVFAPSGFAFGRFMEADKGVMAFQELLVTGADGKNWTAVYKLLKQPDGSWKIGGVGLYPNNQSKGI